jgi:hypothetical protein
MPTSCTLGFNSLLHRTIEFTTSKSKSHYDWRSVSQSVSLGVEPYLGPMTRYLLLFDSYGLVFCGTPSVTRGRVCLSYMLLALASAVLLGSEFLGTRDYIFLSQIWDFPFRRLLRLAVQSQYSLTYATYMMKKKCVRVLTCTLDVTETCGQTLGTNSTYQNNNKNVYINTCPETLFCEL